MLEPYPWQTHRDSWSETCPSMASALEALQQASYGRPRWQEVSKAYWDFDGLKFNFRWRMTRRFPGRRQSWSDGSFFDGIRSVINAGVINLRETEAFEKGNYTYRRVSLPHEFEFEITVTAPHGEAATAEFVLTEQIDPDQTVRDFQHGVEAVESRLPEVKNEFRRSFNPQRRLTTSGSWEDSGTGQIQRLTPGQVKAVVSETVDRCVTEGWLPRYERTGKFRTPGHKSPIVSSAAWELAHYAQRLGPLYHDEQAWKFAHDLIESFMAKGVTAGTFATELPNVFGPLKGVQANWLSKDLPILFGQCGFSTGPAASGGFDAVFHTRGSATISDLPEPHGKWLQFQMKAPRWDSKVELEMDVQAKVNPDPKSGDACLSLRLSTFAPTVVERLALATKQKYGVAVAVPALRSPNAKLPPASTPAPARQSQSRVYQLPPGSWKKM